jgi:cytochrome c-type biogenesis protein CcmH
MAIWMLFMAMTAAAVMAVLWPLSRRWAFDNPSDPNTQFYREQIAEIERDRERGLLSASEADAAKTEAGRRLLRASATRPTSLSSVGEPALRRRRAASALALSAVPILALALYGAHGSPQMAGQALVAGSKQPADQMDIGAAVGRIEAHLAQNPQDGRGWEVIAPVYLRMGRAGDAVKAYETALRLLGPDANRLAQYGEALVTAQDGMVPAEARGAFEKALQLDPTSAKARFYLARAAQQDGDREKAYAGYTALLASAPNDAPWVPVVKDEISRLQDTATSTQPDREAILGMVEGLATRLESQGGSADEWSRLIRSYAVLGDTAKAKAAGRKAREALAPDQTAIGRIDAIARDLNIDAN